MPSWRPKPKREYKQRDSRVTSAMMSRVRHKENRAEILLRKSLWRLGFRYKLQDKSLVGRPDLVFPKYRVLVFVDGDYWHGRALLEGGESSLKEVIRGARYEWWRDKLSRTIERDRHVTESLTNAGWRVIRIWESDILADPDRVVSRVVASLRPSSANDVYVRDSFNATGDLPRGTPVD